MLDKQQEIHCLATVLWHESRGESVKGQLAVASVVLNRAIKKNTTVCNVMSHSKQFSWYANKPELLDKSILWKQLYLAEGAYAKFAVGKHDTTRGASHFVTKNTHNYWTRKLKHVATIGNHKLYKEM